MGKYASNRNFGYGKQMAFAGKEALRDHYGGGHFRTVAAHSERWGRFVAWAREQGIRDAARIDQGTVERYAAHVGAQVERGERSTAYAQNLLSTVNVTLAALRGDREIRVSPSQWVGERSGVRSEAPTGLDRNQVQAAAEALRGHGLERAAAVVELARELGVRFREAMLADLSRWGREAEKYNAINVLDGTKGGRDAPRWVTLSESGRDALSAALAARPEGSRNLVAPGEQYVQARRGELHAARETLREYGIAGYHDLRAAYACERYQALTGHIAPVLGGKIEDRETDRVAREQISYELGHGRIDVVAAYIGGRG